MKTRKQVAELMDRIFLECQATREQRQKEYAHKETNALANFERTGKDIDVSREKAWFIYANKHWDGIKAYINGHKSQREDIRGRIKDVIVYCVLFWAMVDDNETPNVNAVEEFEPFEPQRRFLYSEKDIEWAIAAIESTSRYRVIDLQALNKQ